MKRHNPYNYTNLRDVTLKICQLKRSSVGFVLYFLISFFSIFPFCEGNMSSRKSDLVCQEVPPGKRTCCEGNNNDSDLSEGNYNKSNLSVFPFPVDCFVIVSCFLTPLDVCQLCLTSRVFHGASCTKAGNVEESLVSEKSKSVAKAMLNASMTTSLDAVLRHNRAGFGVAEFKNLRSSLLLKGQRCNSVILSGSIVLQAMLGGPFSKHSKTDVDMFCSREAAAAARTWLVDPKGGNALYYRTKTNFYTSTFCEYVDRDIGGDIVSHVEAYGPMPSKRELFLNRLRVSSDIRGLSDRTTQQSRRLQKIRFPLRTQNEIEQDPRSDFSCDPKSPHPFLFIDRVGRHDELSDDESSLDSADSDKTGMPKPNVDLVIAEEGSTAQDLVKRFDLDVCMCSYDGQTFHIENPKHVFNTLPKDGGGCLSVPISTGGGTSYVALAT